MKPIKFNTENVQAILRTDSPKTQTRRIMKPQPSQNWTPYSFGEVHKIENGEFPLCNGLPVVIGYGYSNRDGDEAHISRYQVGDILYVREKWFDLCSVCIHNQDEYPDVLCSCMFECEPLLYKACDENRFDGKWKSPATMPKEAARIFLRVTDVRAERIQDIRDHDAIAEGAMFTDFGTYIPKGMISIDGGKTYHQFNENQYAGWSMESQFCPTQCHGTARGAFSEYWGKVYGKGAWERNDWVWVYTFERCEKPKGD